MRWTTHQVGAVGLALILKLPAAGILAAALGGILPDLIDQRIAGCFHRRQQAFNRIHRGFTHWPGLWLGLLALALALIPPQFSAIAGPFALGLAAGGLSHVVLDMLTPQGIPLLPFTRRGRVSLKLCRTGGLGEWIFLAAMLAGLAFWFRESLNDRGLAATLKAMLGL
jgi:inner membrane protein